MNKPNHSRPARPLRGLIVSLALGLVFLLAACRGNEPAATATEIAVVPGTPVPSPATVMAATATAVPPTPTAAPTATPEPTEPAALAYTPLFEPAGCQFDVPPGREVECGYLIVPEDRSQLDPGGNTVRLHVAIFKSENDTPAPDPVIYLEGGPGGDALESVPFAFERRFAPFLADRDFIMFDQRGTGYSEPSLACPEYTELVFDTVEERLTLAEENALTLNALDACHDRLVDEGVNLTAYNSAANAADVNDLRLALGYDEWNLYGISYGTRLAQTVMRDHPEGIRSVVLDSVYPPAADLVLETPANVERAFAVFFAGCAADPACSEAYPNLDIRFFDLVDRLNTTPITVAVRDFFTGENYDAPLDGIDLIGVVFQSLYSTEIIPLLPQLIAEVAEGNYQNLSTLLSSFLADNEFFSIGMQYSVQCHEEISFSQPGDEATDLVAYPQLEQFFVGSSELDAAVCAAWGAGMADAIENEPITSDIPTLVLAGQYDPITPPAWGLAVAAALSDHYYFEFPGVGHGVSVSGECPLSITQAFLNGPAQEPDATCIAAMAGPEFAVSGTAAGAITLVPFTADLGVAQVEGVVPQGWEEAAPGIYGRMNTALDQTFILQQAIPGARGEQFLNLLAGQLGLDESPSSTGVYEAENRTWTLYETALQGLPADIALAEDGDYTYLVLLVTPADERDALYTAVFLPALEALRVN